MDGKIIVYFDNEKELGQLHFWKISDIEKGIQKNKGLDVKIIQKKLNIV